MKNNVKDKKLIFNSIIKWFENVFNDIPYSEDLIKSLPESPFTHSTRNKAFRSHAFKNFLSHFLADDERAKLFGLSNGCRMREGVQIYTPEKLSIGEHCWIGKDAILDATGGLKIGSHTTIGPSVFIWSHSTHLANLTLNNFMGTDKKYYSTKSTVIGDGCFIGASSIILPGVTIGEKCIVSPQSRVDRNLPPRTVFDNNFVKNGFLTDSRINRMLSIINSNF